MSKQEIISYSDDLNGEQTEDVKRVPFGYLGTYYEVDLNSEHQKELYEALQKFIAAATPIKPQHLDIPKQRQGHGEAKKHREELANMRNWAREHGFTVSDRGRIPKRVRNAYLSRNQET